MDTAGLKKRRPRVLLGCLWRGSIQHFSPHLWRKDKIQAIVIWPLLLPFGEVISQRMTFHDQKTFRAQVGELSQRSQSGPFYKVPGFLCLCPMYFLHSWFRTLHYIAKKNKKRLPEKIQCEWMITWDYNWDETGMWLTGRSQASHYPRLITHSSVIRLLGHSNLPNLCHSNF